MTGLAGFLRLDGAPAERAHLDAMLDAMPHRTRAGVGVLLDGPLALAQLGPPLVPESAGETEPVRLPGDAVAVGDVRLDDRPALLSALDVHAADAPGDLTLAGLVWRRWGMETFDRLEGDFALALWDPGRRTLTCARDVFGVKPFAYHHGRRVFAFASQPSAVAAHPDVGRRPSEGAIARYLVDRIDDEAVTFFDGVLRLPPAHVLTVSATGEPRSPRRYWYFDPNAAVDLGSDAAYEEGFRRLLERAVQGRTRATVPVGFGLSGGLDSSSVVGVARELQPSASPPVFSVVFDAPSADEREYLERVEARVGVEAVRIGDADLDLADGALDDPDGPYVTAGKAMEDALFARAAREGVGVLLDGFDGDTVLGHGLGRLTDLALGFRLIKLWRETGAVGRTLGGTRRGTLRAHVVAPMLPSRPLDGYRTRRHGGGPHVELASAEFLARVDLPAPARATDRPHAGSVARAEHLADLSAPVNALVLEILDHLAVRSGVEVRHPFFDRRLASFCLGLPRDQILRDGWPRSIQRRAMAGTVPDEIRWRPTKSTLGGLLPARYARQGWDRVSDLVRKGGGAASRYLDRVALERAYRAAALEESEDAQAALWAAVALENWLVSVR